jgi:hypothetical protein
MNNQPSGSFQQRCSGAGLKTLTTTGGLIDWMKDLVIGDGKL